jgi:uncharacterized coiled-coil protein SlyX
MMERGDRSGSSSAAPSTAQLGARLTELEIKFCHQDDTLEKLSAVLIAQQEQIDRLERKLAELEARRWDAEGDEPGPPDEVPPHY